MKCKQDILQIRIVSNYKQNMNWLFQMESVSLKYHDAKCMCPSIYVNTIKDFRRISFQSNISWSKTMHKHHLALHVYIKDSGLIHIKMTFLKEEKNTPLGLFLENPTQHIDQVTVTTITRRTPPVLPTIVYMTLLPIWRSGACIVDKKSC